MKNQNCPAYNKNTETQKTLIGSARGEPLYSEKEIILSEYCTVLNKYDDFDCGTCKFKFSENNN